LKPPGTASKAAEAAPPHPLPPPRESGPATKKGLTVRSELDSNAHEKGIKVSDAEMAALNIEGDGSIPNGITPSSRVVLIGSSPETGRSFGNEIVFDISPREESKSLRKFAHIPFGTLASNRIFR
jgi:hypothetical protein